MFWKQLVLWYIKKDDSKKVKKQRKKFLLYSSPIKYFQNIDNPIDSETLKIIKKCYFITNKYHSKYSPNFQENKTIKVINTFSFAPYIISWFFLTFFFQDKIFKFIINWWIEMIKYFFHK